MAATPTTPTASAPSSIVTGGLVRSTIHMFGFSIYHFRNLEPVGQLRFLRNQCFPDPSRQGLRAEAAFLLSPVYGVRRSGVAYPPLAGNRYVQPASGPESGTKSAPKAA